MTATEFATVLGDQNGPAVSTTEHVMAALHGLGVDNAVVEVDGPEVPIMDGSAAPFVAAIDQVGIVTLPASRRYIQVLKPVRVAKGDSYGELRPHPRGLRIETEIEFDHPLIGRQAFAVDVEPEFVPPRPGAGANLRLHARRRETVERGLCARRVVRKYRRDRREPRPQSRRRCASRTSSSGTRRSMRSATWRLSGAPLIGAYRSVRGGHKLNHAVLTALMADRSAWTYVEMPEIRRPRGHAELATGFASPGLRAGRLLIPLTFTP